MGRFLAAAAAVICVMEAAPVRAQDMPWCVELDVFTRNCAFARYEECAAVAGNATSPATGTGRCVRNPRYQPPPAAAPKAKSSTSQEARKPR